MEKGPDNGNFTVNIEKTDDVCPIGEKVGANNAATGKIPVLSCEGACIRGEIARQAANIVAKSAKYRRLCHGELISVPGSAMHEWALKAERVVLIDGCFLNCHRRTIEGIVGKERLVVFDALSHYRKYSDRFDIDSVPEAERLEVARGVANWVIADLEKETAPGIREKAGAA